MKKEKIQSDAQLMDYYQAGLSVDVEDVFVTDDNVITMNQMVQEGNCYMKDFEENEKGEIDKIHYTKITQC